MKNIDLNRNVILGSILFLLAAANLMACQSVYRHGVPETAQRSDYALIIRHPDVTVKKIDGKKPDMGKRTQELQFREGKYTLELSFFEMFNTQNLYTKETLDVELKAGKQYFLCPDYKKNRIDDFVGVSIYLLEDNDFQSPRLAHSPRTNVPEKCREY